MNKLIPAAFAAAFALSSAAASAAPHTLDPSHSFVIFKASHFGIANAYGMFTKISGSKLPEI
ncbi:MAG: polyisoprenoid-binding protein, partial [Myxococcota bacterium]